MKESRKIKKKIMHVTSLISVPLGYCRLSQRYVLNISDFLLVEILLTILLIILAKGIFAVRISKLQFSIFKTAETAKFLEETVNSEKLKKNDSKTGRGSLKWDSKKRFSRYHVPSSVSSLESKYQPSESSDVPDGSSKMSSRSSSLPDTNKNYSRTPMLEVPLSVKFESCNSSISKVCFDNDAKVVEESQKVASPSDACFEKVSDLIVKSPPCETLNSSNTTYAVREDLNSSATSYLIKISSSKTATNFTPTGARIYKPSKSVPQVLNEKDGSESLDVGKMKNEAAISKVSKSLSQGLHSSDSATEKQGKLNIELQECTSLNKAYKSKSKDVKAA